MSKKLFLILAGLLLLAPAIFAAGCGHCFFAVGDILPTATIEFIPEYVTLPDQNNAYLVPLLSTMNVENIETFMINCINGATTERIIPVRVMLKGPEDENYMEVSNNGYHAVGWTSCEGRPDCNTNVVVGGSNKIENAYVFNLGGIYDIRIEAPRKDNGTDWAAFIEFQVFVAGIDLNVSTLHAEEHMGFFIEPDGMAIEHTKTKEIFWVIKNEAPMGAILLDVEPIGCAEEGLQCELPEFVPETAIPAGGIYYLKERITAAIPNISPTIKSIGIDINATDEYRLTSESFAGTIIPVDQSITFTVLGEAVWGQPIEGSLLLDPGTYYAQVCVDSTVSDYLSPIVALDITYDAGGEGTANLITEAVRFHWVGNCSAPFFQGHGFGDGWATLSFEIQKSQEIIYRYYGDVGTVDINPATGEPYYQNNWGRIGTGYDVNTGYVKSVLKEENLQPQQIMEATDGPYTVDINISNGTQTSGPYTPQPAAPADGELGATAYSLVDITMPDGTIVAGPISRAAEDEATIFIHPTSGLVSVSTSYFEEGPEEHPLSTLVLLWLLRENFLVKISAGKLGVCYGMDGAVGFNGEAVKPKIKFSWTWDNIGIDACNPELEGAVYCDATQFSIALVKRLERIRALAEDQNYEQIALLQQFNAYLIMDGYSDDFRSDFDSYMTTINYEDTPSYYREDWKKYFTDSSKMQFEISEVPDTTLQGPGLYLINLEFDFEEYNPWLFFSQSEPAATIRVIFTKTREPIMGNPFYYLPFNGEVGINAEEDILERDGYGVGFSGDAVRISLHEISGETYLLTKNSDLTNVLSKVYVNKIDDFDYAQKKKPGSVLTISRRESAPLEFIFDLNYSPSYATPVIMEVMSDGRRAEAFYRLIEEGDAIEGNEWMNSWTAIAETIQDQNCLDYSGGNLFYKGRDHQASSIPTCATSELEKSYGLHWDTTKVGESLYLQGIFFTPLDGTIELQNACPIMGKFLAPTTPSGATSFELKENEDYVDSIKTMFDSIEEEMLCMLWTKDGAELWWNWEKIIDDFKDSFPADNPIHADGCDVAQTVMQE